MTGKSVEELVEQLSQTAPLLHEIVEEVRSLVFAVVPAVEERVLYGGIVFEAPIMFCGVFAHSRHVSVEFSRGCDLADPKRVEPARSSLCAESPSVNARLSSAVR